MENLTGKTDEVLEATCEHLERESAKILGKVREIIVEGLKSDARIEEVTEIFESAYASELYDAGADLVVRFAEPFATDSGFEENLIDVRCEIPASVGYEGDMQGWGFGFASTWEGGSIGPGGMIGNFTPDVWIHDDAEIADRLNALRLGAAGFARAVLDEITERFGEE